MRMRRGMMLRAVLRTFKTAHFFQIGHISLQLYADYGRDR